MELNKEIAKTMESLDAINRAEANPFLYEKIMQRVEKPEAQIISIKPAVQWGIAASVALLLALNIFTVTHLNKAEKLSEKNKNAFAAEYFSYITNPQF